MEHCTYFSTVNNDSLSSETEDNNDSLSSETEDLSRDECNGEKWSGCDNNHSLGGAR